MRFIRNCRKVTVYFTGCPQNPGWGGSKDQLGPGKQEHKCIDSSFLEGTALAQTHKCMWIHRRVCCIPTRSGDGDLNGKQLPKNEFLLERFILTSLNCIRTFPSSPRMHCKPLSRRFAFILLLGFAYAVTCVYVHTLTHVHTHYLYSEHTMSNVPRYSKRLLFLPPWLAGVQEPVLASGDCEPCFTSDQNGGQVWTRPSPTSSRDTRQEARTAHQLCPEARSGQGWGGNVSLCIVLGGSWDLTPNSPPIRRAGWRQQDWLRSLLSHSPVLHSTTRWIFGFLKNKVQVFFKCREFIVLAFLLHYFFSRKKQIEHSR